MDRRRQPARGARPQAPGREGDGPVAIPPELVALLRDHIDRFGVGPDGRLFRTERDGPIQEGGYGGVWRKARQKALTAAQAASPLARRPYDFRHAAISLWLSVGVPVTEVARRAGNGVAVVLARYANCIDGDEAIMNERISDALDGAHATLDEALTEEDGAEPVAHPWHAGGETEAHTDETAGGGLA